MKYIIPILISILVISSCKKEDNSIISSDKLINAITNKHYIVARFEVEGADRSADFDDWMFSFGENKASNYSSPGYYVKTTYSVQTIYSKVYFRFCYGDKPPIDALSKRWEVSTIEDTRIKLTHTDDSTKVNTLVTLEQWIF